MQFSRIVNASKRDNSSTILITAELEVKILAIFSGKAIIIEKNMNPTRTAVSTTPAVANFAPSALPAPSSFATRTLY